MEKGENIPTPTQLPSDSESYHDHQEHTRQLLFEMLKERGEILIENRKKN